MTTLTTINKRHINYCMSNWKKYLQQTTLHGLKFIADGSITVFERSFFLCTFIAAFITTINLISIVYAKWNSTPVIIGTSPHPTSILKIPFPAVTVCNMNQVLLSKVSNYSEDSFESAVLKILCFNKVELDSNLNKTANFKNNNLKISDFLINNSQPCSKMLVSCQFGFTSSNCSELFREVLTDEGLCCVFNVIHPDFLYHDHYRIMMKNFPRNDGSTPINWNPETGYQTDLPEKYYPVPARGTGVTMGFSIMLNAEINEYYCSTTDGPGFKVALHNSIESPNIREIGTIVPIGYETRIRMEALSTEAMPSIRSLHWNSRQCLFNNEVKLSFYKHYTRSNCENECLAKYLYASCQCIPFQLPLIYSNVSTCAVNDIICIGKAEKSWHQENRGVCRSHCLPRCFDLTFSASTFSTPLVQQNYIIGNELLRNMSKDSIRENISIMHFYYQETVFHGNLKTVYVGFTEFLSNTGGIMGLFLGFSFISVAEIIYFLFLRPIFEYVFPHRRHMRLEKVRKFGLRK